jgi:uncharacterized protein YecE (DUF72 family)
LSKLNSKRTTTQSLSNSIWQENSDIENMRNKKINIGTSGWSYKHWKGAFYPQEMKPIEYLLFYTQHFDITEINASFYRLPLKSTVENWVKKVPKHFRFCPKINRYITHIKRLHDPEETVARFFEVFEPMKEKMGPVLVQLPPSLKFDYDVAEHFYSTLKKNFKEYSFAMEVRHETWMAEESLTLMSKYDMAFVISQSGERFPYAETVTAKNIYVRFHGPKELYASSYSDKMLKDFAKKFQRWIDKGHYVWAFFNNDVGLHAIYNAKTLKEMMKR